MGLLAASPRRSRWTQDPEALLLLTLEVARDDPRLFDEVLDWMVRNEGLLSVRRLRMLAKRPEDRQLAEAAVAWAAQWRRPSVRAQVRSSSPPEPSEPLFRTPSLLGTHPDPVFARYGFLRSLAEPSDKSREPDLVAPVNFAFRLRQLLGQGTRAEAVRYLLCVDLDDASTSEVAATSGYARRNVQEALTSLQATGVVRLSTRTGEQRYSVDRARWAYLLDLDPEELPLWRDWPALLGALRDVVRWLQRSDLDELSEYLRASQAADLLDVVRPQLNRAGVLLPARRGGKQSWADLEDTVEVALYWLSPPAHVHGRPAGFEIVRDHSGGHRWRLTGSSGRIVANSAESYASVGSARTAVRRLQDGLRRFHVRAAPDAGAYRWVVVAENGRVLAASGDSFASELDAERASRDARELIERAATPEEAAAQQPDRRRRHVTEGQDGRWAVRAEDGKRTVSTHRTRTDAVRAAEEQVRSTWGSGEVVVHARDGRIVASDTITPKG